MRRPISIFLALNAAACSPALIKMPSCPPPAPSVFVRAIRAPLPATVVLPHLAAVPCGKTSGAALCFDAAGRQALLAGITALKADDARVREMYQERQ